MIADAKPEDEELVRSFGADVVVPRGAAASPTRCSRRRPTAPTRVYDTALLRRAAFAAIRDGGQIVVVRGWDGDEVEDRGIRVHPVMVATVLERTDWLEELRALASSGRLKLRVAEEYPARAGRRGAARDGRRRAARAGRDRVLRSSPCRSRVGGSACSEAVEHRAGRVVARGSRSPRRRGGRRRRTATRSRWSVSTPHVPTSSSDSANGQARSRWKMWPPRHPELGLDLGRRERLEARAGSPRSARPARRSASAAWRRPRAPWRRRRANSRAGMCSPNSVSVWTPAARSSARQDARVGQRVAVDLARRQRRGSRRRRPAGRPRRAARSPR